MMLTSLVSLNDPRGARGDIRPERFFQMLLDVMSRGDEQGVIAVLQSKNRVVLGYTVIIDGTDICSFCRVAVGYVLYSNGKCPTAGVDMTVLAERWARMYGYNEMHGISRRINGAAMRLFEKKLGFSRYYVAFRKQL